MIRKLLATAVLAMVVTAGTAWADAPDPIPADTHLVSFQVNSDGSRTITIAGAWQWPTHNSDCNTDRSGVGYAIAWNDPADPGNLVGTNQLSALVGTTTTFDPASWYDVNLRDGNLAHAAMPGNDPGLGPTVSYSVANNGGIPTQADANNWISSCGTFAPHTVTGSNGQQTTESFNSGTWGPISHTYGPSYSGPFTVCPIMYDPHQGPAGTPNGQPSQITAGGDKRNSDNSIQTNGDTPLGNGCFTTTIAAPQLTTQASAGVTVGTAITDTAQLANGSSPTGTITWKLYGPNDLGCTAAAPPTVTATVSGANGTFTSPSLTPSASGTYQWVASYSGDAHNAAATTPCADTAEQVVVSPAARQQVQACVAGSATIKKVLFNKPKRHVLAVVQGAGIEKVAFLLDGKQIQTLTAPNGPNGTYHVNVRLAKTAFGNHRLTAQVTVNCGPLQSKAITFRRAAPKRRVTPKFTG